MLHGSSGVPDKAMIAATGQAHQNGNVSTHLNGFFTRAVRGYLEQIRP